MRKILAGAACLALLLFLVQPEPSPEAGGPGLQKPRELPAVEPGDLVFRYGTGRWSRYFRDLSQRERRFSHVGIVAPECEGVAVIHASADDLTGVGAVHRETLAAFAAECEDLAVFRVRGDAQRRRRIADSASACVGRPFDARFDLATTGAVYCSELVRMVVNGELREEAVTTTRVAGRDIVAIDDCYGGTWFTNVYEGRR